MTEAGTGTLVSLQVGDGLAQLTLRRPERHNAIDAEVVHDLARAMSELSAASDVRAVLVAAEGADFTVGGDLDHLAASADSLVDELRTNVAVYHGALETLYSLDVPVLCAVQGAAAGGGVGLMWAADGVIAASDLRLAPGNVSVGLGPDGGSTWALPRLAGEHRARAVLLFGRTLSAVEALEWGLVDRVVEPDALRPDAEAWARELAAGPTVAYCQIKRLLRSSLQMGWAEQLAAERLALMTSGSSADAREGVLSFIERRPPRFAGH
ncbi:MAG TPA: enoyl-CoA hydratase/isomerase family protein [Acidimicrobiales bacterium]|nr:enoyl-CoA hydratase/isomerase family protein [Acidimicrobiales bacterium]